jgi:HD-like signal output (HDOD) protein
LIASPLPREKLLFAAKTLPAAPRILARLGEMLRDPEVGLDDIIELLRADAGLTALVMRVANSAAYNSGGSFESLEQALPRVGLTEVYRLVGLAAAAQLTENSLPFYGLSGLRLRENSLYIGLAMEALARAARMDPRVAYTAGILRSIGKLVLDRLMRGSDYSSGYAARGNHALGDWESAVIGLSNVEAASLLLDIWHFPGNTVATIRDHYAPAPDSPPLATLLNLAAGMAEAAGHELPGEAAYWEMSPEKLQVAGIDAAAMERAAKTTDAIFASVRVALG